MSRLTQSFGRRPFLAWQSFDPSDCRADDLQMFIDELPRADRGTEVRLGYNNSLEWPRATTVRLHRGCVTRTNYCVERPDEAVLKDRTPPDDRAPGPDIVWRSKTVRPRSPARLESQLRKTTVLYIAQLRDAVDQTERSSGMCLDGCCDYVSRSAGSDFEEVCYFAGFASKTLSRIEHRVHCVIESGSEHFFPDPLTRLRWRRLGI